MFANSLSFLQTVRSPPRTGPPPLHRPVKLSMPAPLAPSQGSASGTEPSQGRHHSRNQSMSSHGSRSTQQHHRARQPQMVVVPRVQQNQGPRPFLPPQQQQPTPSTSQQAFVNNGWNSNSVAAQQAPATPGSRFTEPISIAVQTPVRPFVIFCMTSVISIFPRPKLSYDASLNFAILNPLERVVCVFRAPDHRRTTTTAYHLFIRSHFSTTILISSSVSSLCYTISLGLRQVNLGPTPMRSCLALSTSLRSFPHHPRRAAAAHRPLSPTAIPFRTTPPNLRPHSLLRRARVVSIGQVLQMLRTAAAGLTIHGTMMMKHITAASLHQTWQQDMYILLPSATTVSAVPVLPKCHHLGHPVIYGRIQRHRRLRYRHRSLRTLSIIRGRLHRVLLEVIPSISSRNMWRRILAVFILAVS